MQKVIRLTGSAGQTLGMFLVNNWDAGFALRLNLLESQWRNAGTSCLDVMASLLKEQGYDVHPVEYADYRIIPFPCK